MNGDDPVCLQGVLWFGRATVGQEHGRTVPLAQV
jgi:hypothetical protein